MPTIPLFNEGGTVRAARVTPPNLAKTHQVVININDAARNYGAAAIPNSLADRRGMIAMGQAFGDVGNALYVRAQKQAEAINIRHAAEADMEMDAAYADFENWKLSNPEETKWAGEWQSRLEGLRARVLREDHSPQASEQIGLKFDAFSQRSLSNVATSAAKTSFAKAGETLTAQALQAYDGGRFEEGDAIIADGVRRNYIAGDVAARMQISARHQAESQGRDELKNLVSAAIDERRIDDAKSLVADSPLLKDHEKQARLADIGASAEAAKQADEIQALTLTNPSEAVQRLSDPANFDKIAPGDRAAMIVRAKEVQAAGAGDAFRDIKTRISLGQVGKDESFDGPGMQDLTPIMRDILKAENAARHDEQAKATRIALQNSPAIYENAVGVISKYDPADDSGGLRRAEIGAALETNFSGPYLDELKKRLDERGTRPPNEIDTAPALALIQEWTEGGGLGEYKKPVTQDGVAVMTEPKKVGVTAKTPRSFLGIDYLWPDSGGADVMGQAKPVTEIDPVAQAQAASKQAAIRKAIESEVKAGKFKSNDEVLNRTIELYQQHGGKAPASTAPAQSGASLLLPPPAAAQAEMEKALSILNYKPAK